MPQEIEVGQKVWLPDFNQEGVVKEVKPLVIENQSFEFHYPREPRGTIKVHILMKHTGKWIHFEGPVLPPETRKKEGQNGQNSGNKKDGWGLGE